MGQTKGVTRGLLFFGMCAISTLWAHEAPAADPAIKIDANARTLAYAGGTVPIALPQIAKSSLDDVAIAPGKTVTHARAESAEGATWEAIVAHDKVVFSGRTGYVR